MHRKHMKLGVLIAFAGAFGVATAQSTSVKPLAAPQIAPASSGKLAPQQPGVLAAQGSPVQAPMPAPLPAGMVSVDLKKEALDQVAPLSAKEVLELRKELEDRSDAMTEPMRTVPTPVRRQITYDLSPEAPPQVIRTSMGQGSAIVFVDAAGRPWPAEFSDQFSPKNFSVSAFGDNGVSVVVKRPGVQRANVILRLPGLLTPVSFSVISEQTETDYSVEVVIPRLNPTLVAPVGDVVERRALGAAALMDYLFNTPPKSAKLLTVDAPGFKAWQISPERMIVRTDALIASPAWSRRQSSVAGLTVYDLPLTPVITVSKGGQESNIVVTGFESTREQK